MTIINENSVVVFSFEELKDVLESDNSYFTVYFGSNITLLNGIKISSTKPNIIIDGTYNDTTYTLEDKKSTSAGDTITASSPLIQKVIVQNINIVGYNYYGVIYVPENSTYKDIIVEYNNITYIGPQISYHPVGLTRFIDSNITIQTNYATGNEVAECNRIEIGGKTTIIHKSTGNSSFWFRNSNPSLKILTDAIVNFTSESRELFYGVNNLSFTVSKNAKFYVTSHSGMGYGTFGTGITIIDQNALFSLKQTTYNGGYAAWYSYGTITLNEYSTLDIINNYTNITTSNYNIYFNGSSAGFILNNPNKVVLYNSVANVIYTNSNIPFSFKYNRINLFNTSIKIDSELSNATLPTYAWYKESSLSLIDGTFTSTTTTISGNNYTEEELKSLPSLTNFIFPNKKIFSIGDFPIHMDVLTDKDTQMKGITNPNSEVLIEYDSISSRVVASSDGSFSYSYETPLAIGTIITLTARQSNDFIYHTKKIQIVYSGELIIDSASKLISFKYNPIKTNPTLCPRSIELKVVVIDSRAVSSNWKLYASINHDLISSTGVSLKNSLVFVDENGVITPLSTTPLLVYTGENNEGSTKITNVTWDDEKGILLQIIDPLINNLEYITDINWSLEE